MGSTPSDEGGRVDWHAVEALLERDRHEEENRIKAEQNAIRFAGQQEYQSLVEGGATPEEALRRTAHKLYYNSPEHLTAALRYTKPPPPLATNIQAVPIMGADGKPIGMGVPNPRGGVHLVPQPKPAVTPFDAQVKEFEGEKYLQTAPGRFQHIPRPGSTRLTPAQQRELELARRELSSEQGKLNAASSVLIKAKAERFTKKSVLQQLEQQVSDATTKVEAAKKRFRAAGLSDSSAETSTTPATREARALPDSKDNLEANVTYKTPKGEFTWTGSGWVKAESALPLSSSGDIEETDAGNE